MDENKFLTRRRLEKVFRDLEKLSEFEKIHQQKELKEKAVRLLYQYSKFPLLKPFDRDFISECYEKLQKF